MSLICLECDKTETLRAWDQQDGFAKARIAGWTIGDEAMCPQCSTKLILVQ
jgi:DNA-directed RNA polymerase subunit RPC12/RpoP